VHALRRHEFLFEKCAQQNSADFSGAEHRQASIQKFPRMWRFHGACIVDEAKPSVNILPSAALQFLGSAIRLLEAYIARRVLESRVQV
jgi:hypothetical protein